ARHGAVENFSYKEEARGEIRRTPGLNRMQHGITEQMWLDYVDGTAPLRDRRLIGQHIEECGECFRTFSELDTWRTLMMGEASRLRLAMELPDSHVDRLLTSAIDKIRAAGPAAIRSDSGWTAGEGMMLLRSLLEPICGHGT